MNRIMRLSRKEVSRYKSSDLWTSRECEVFLKYCPSKRDRAFLSMTIDTFCSPSELVNLKIGDIKFKKTYDGLKHFTEITINGKTEQRTVP
jgi:integrase